MQERAYRSLKAHYEGCLERHGDSFKGVDWPSAESAETTYRVMLGLIREEPRDRLSLLDFGCGASHLYEYMLRHTIDTVSYSGLDISEVFVELSRRKFPANTYYCLDFLEQHHNLPSFDYIVMNGVFTEKLQLPFDDMLAFFKTMLRLAFPKARKGLAVNVMSKQVDWERDDLFHLPMDVLAAFLSEELSRKFVFRYDYGLFQYTAYVYK